MTKQELWACYGWLYPPDSIGYMAVFRKKSNNNGTADPLAYADWLEYREYFLTHQLGWEK